ncbi:hypothetical protein [Methanococcoides sp. FTZ1]|uniref:hypothetical protein n=1 Tax=Methanococcoides sp. FTZ1 TaxID=3439061 RepID=UPI003F836188
MAIASSDLVLGKNVKWYQGGVATEETITIDATDVSNGYFSLTTQAEFGLIRATVDGVETAMTQLQDDGSTPATHSSGVYKLDYTGLAENDVVVVKYIAIAATAMTHIATSQGGNASISADTTSAAIDGQATKVKSVGAADCTCTLNELDYNEDFIAAVIGTKLSDDIASGKSSWSNAFRGFNKIGALVGIERDSSDAVVKKYGLIGAQGNNAAFDFTTEDFYKKNYSFQVDFMIVADLD